MNGLIISFKYFICSLLLFKNFDLNSFCENKYPGLFDWSYILKDINKENKDPKFDRFSFSLFDHILDLVHSGYAFMPYALFLACQDKLEEDNHFVLDGHFNCYKVKEGETISISAG